MIRRRVSGGSMGGGLKRRAKPWEIKYTNQFSSKLDLPFPCWTESNRPSRTSRWCWRRRSIWCCDAWCFELSSLSLYLSFYLCIFISLVIGQQLLRTFSLLLFLCWGLTIWFGNTFWRRCISLCRAESIHSFINCTLNKYTNTHTRIRTTNTHTHCA